MLTFKPDEVDFNASRSENFPAKNVVSGTARLFLCDRHADCNDTPDTAAENVTRKIKGFFTSFNEIFPLLHAICT